MSVISETRRGFREDAQESGTEKSKQQPKRGMGTTQKTDFKLNKKNTKSSHRFNNRERPLNFTIHSAREHRLVNRHQARL